MFLTPLTLLGDILGVAIFISFLLGNLLHSYRTDLSKYPDIKYGCFFGGVFTPYVVRNIPSLLKALLNSKDDNDMIQKGIALAIPSTFVVSKAVSCLND